MKEQIFEIFFNQGEIQETFFRDIEKDIFSEERVIFRKKKIEKGKKKTKQKREEQLEGFH